MLNTHAHTRAHAGQSVRTESEGASTALHSFPQRRGFLGPGASIPRSQGAPRGPTAPRPAPILPQPPRPLHRYTQPHRPALYHDRQRRPCAGAAATPASHSFVALSSCSPPPRHPAAPLRLAALCLPRPGRPGWPRRRRGAPTTPESRRLRNRGGAQGECQGRMAKRKGKEREQKFRPLGPQPRPHLLPRPPQPPRSPPSEPRPPGVGA